MRPRLLTKRHPTPTMPDRLALQEYVTTQLVTLDAAERVALTAAGVTVTPVVGTADRYDLRPGSTVGVIRVGTRQFDIVPKIGIRRLLYLLSWSHDRIQWEADLATYGTEDSLVEVLAAAFARQVDRTFARGAVRGYRHVQERGLTVRGRIDIAQQVRREHGRMLPINVSYDDHTLDTDANRLLLAAATRLRSLPINASRTRRLLVRCLDRLDGVTLIRYRPRHLPRPRTTRLDAHYRPALALARLVLQATSIEAGQGRAQADAMLFDMNQVFEDFVVHALRETLGLSPHAFPRNNRRLHLDQGRKVTLEPDLSWIEDGAHVFVGDVKYKRVAATGILHPDLYQVHAYARAAGLPSTMLVYAKGEHDPATHQVVLGGPSIEVVAIDLEQDLNGIHDEVRRVADRVCHHAERGREVRNARLADPQAATVLTA